MSAGGETIEPTPSEDFDGPGAAVARARRDVMKRGLPRFAAVWVGVAVGWSIVLCVESLLAPPLTVPILAVQAVIIAAAIAVVRADPAASRVLPVVAAMCVLLGLTVTIIFAAVGGSGDFLAYVLLTLYLAAALFFAWGWQAELVVLVATVVPWLIAIPALVFHVPTAELVTAIVTGSAICLAVAEGGARRLAVTLQHRANEERSRRELEVSRDAYRDLAEEAERARVEADRARAEAEAATRGRDEFLATLSHELRSPLGVVLTWTRMLRRRLVGEERVPKALASIENAARAQVRLVEDLLDISRIAAGKLSLELESVDLPAVLAARVEAVRAAAVAKRIALDVPLDPALGPVRGDLTRLQQVFENLLSNALKFTPEGGRITVTLERADGDAQVTVSDTGIGIPADVLPHVFDQFRQADSSITRRYGGLGLGLAIARRLVEMHRGRIEAESAGEGRGAAFRVWLPLAAAPAAVGREAVRGESPHAPLPALDRLRVLVVDDEPNAREMLTTLLARCGAEVRSAASVREALEGVETGVPDVVVADIAMPDEDGYALVREIRLRGSRIPAIAVTALASGEDRARAMAEGFDAHLTKPVEPEELVAAVARSVASRVL